jgi:RNA-binding motif X-linked protein 2
MNTIREIQSINKRELETLTPPEGSWHRDFADTAFIYIGGLPFDLSEGDILTIFSQYGEPTYINLIRDKESGKSKGFCFLKYEDQRSTDLAVDNLGGAVVMGRVLKVDHTRYKRKDGEEEEEAARELREVVKDGGVSDEDVEEKRRPLIKEEIELLKLEREHDDDDPMKDYLVQEKKEEVARALARLKKDGGRDGEKTRSHRHHHRSHRDKDGRRERRRSDVSDDRDGPRHRYGHHHRRRSRSP